MFISRKINGPGVRYEIVIRVNIGQVVCAHGSFECGMYNDMKIFNTRLGNELGEQEGIIADRGYPQFKAWTPYSERPEMQITTRRLRARHEMLNSCLKQFNIVTPVQA